ncbi:MAG: peptidoglycan -binding protein [Acetobacteraceae bacterium]|nr:peptidoglycan -binding protein [Acetobacteraceae bacterium]
MNAWPGYVDALSTLLMVIIFVLLVFVLGQAFLSVALSGRDQALDRAGRQLTELADMLSLERGRTTDLKLSLAQLSRDLATGTVARDMLVQELASLRTQQGRTLTERDVLARDRDQLAARLVDADTQIAARQARNDAQQAQLNALATRLDTASNDAAGNAAKIIAAQRQLDATNNDLAGAQSRLSEMQRQSEALDRTVKADRATLELRLSDLARLAEQNKALAALRDELELQARDAAARATTEAERGKAATALLVDERRLADSSRAQMSLLNRQIAELRAQMGSAQRALDAAESAGKDKDVQIVNLGSRLNAALAQKIEELQSYRSDFFGRLRAVLANRPGIQVVGDRFVFQSEVLFPVGSADLSVNGWDQMKTLAATIMEISAKIPPEVNWLLRIDGHADRQPLQGGGRFASNWELSSSRAITVVKLLVGEGVPANRLAASGFGDNQALDNSDSPEAYAKNRRIEIRLTDR